MLQTGWITVAGLASDIAGTSVLAWDLLPEYKIYRWRAHSKLFHEPSPKLLIELEHYRQRPDDPFLGLTMEIGFVGPLNTLRRAVGLSYIDFQKTTEDPVEMLGASEKEVGDAIDAAALRLHNRRRPPLRQGIVLIAAGFLLQLIGQLASMHLF